MNVGRVRGAVHCTNEVGRTFDQSITEKDLGMSMDAAKKLVGDGEASVSVSLELKETDYGTGFGAHVSVTLTCEQEEKTLRTANTLALALAEEFAQESFQIAKDLFISMRTN